MGKHTLPVDYTKLHWSKKKKSESNILKNKKRNVFIVDITYLRVLQRK